MAHGADGAASAGALDLRRKAQIAWARPTDHAKDVVAKRQGNFDMERTIFRTLDGALPRAMVRDRLDVELFWSDKATAQILSAFEKIPPPMPHDRALVEFMHTECNFSMEHADGSFMDHLRFCYEYSAAHYKERSPRVLLLHSILGVGTNYFPMEAEKIPKLQALVSDFEMQHIEAFPSVLRLLLHGPLLDELAGRIPDELKELQGIEMHRVIDNKPMTIDAEALWIQLNYQLIHLLDFLPAANWAENLDDTFLPPFIELHALLVRAGKLFAKVDFNLTFGDTSNLARPPLSLGRMIRNIVPQGVKRHMSRKAIADFSGKIGHSLQYRLQWKPRSRH